jgi:hypothetical protein
MRDEHQQMEQEHEMMMQEPNYAGRTPAHD